ncbi:MAG: helix-turn-helix domain-containing protein [Lachnospiraceae bacterium]|nr:helix-turn-helix domain-containing protein [Lachnospiraceae bacterium]
MDIVTYPEVRYGNYIKKIRTQKGFSQEELSEEMGWSKSVLSKVENNKRGVTMDEIYHIACILNEPLSSFFPELVVEIDEEYMTSFEGIADEIASLYVEIEEAGGRVEGEIMDRVAEMFQRTIPQHLHRILNSSASKVQIQGTVMRGPHFIPRVEIYLLDRNGEPIPWFYIALIFKDNLKHTYLCLVQSDDIKYRAEVEPVDQAAQMSVIRDVAIQHLDVKGNSAWRAMTEISGDVFVDENGIPPEYGTIISTGYIPMTPPDEMCAWTGKRILKYQKPFVADNVDGFTYDEQGTVAKQIISCARDNKKLPPDEYRLYTDLDEDVVEMFKMLQLLIDDVLNSSFINWKSIEIRGSLSSQTQEYQKRLYDVIRRYLEMYNQKGRNQISKIDYNKAILSYLTAFKTKVESYSEQEIKDIALRKQEYKCAVNPQHLSFMDRKSGKPYLEAAYIVPLSAQPDFKKDLNCVENTVCLCPTCNSRLIHGTEEDIEDMIVSLFYSHRDELKKAGIDVGLRQLLQYYAKR